MQYMGGKAKIARKIVQAVLGDTDNRSIWVEPFVGGGNVIEHAAEHFNSSIGLDAHEDLILLWQAAAQGWLAPDLTKERYQELRSQSPSALRGYAGFGASFGGKWFGGYGVSPRDGEVWKASQRAIQRQGRVFMKHQVKFYQLPFGTYTPLPGSVVYCDPPYAGTTGYSTGSFDHAWFYRVLAEWSRTCQVYVSEYTIPSAVRTSVVWSQQKRNVLEKSDNARLTTEYLFKVLP